MKENVSLDQNQYHKLGMDASYLAACALHGQRPDWDGGEDLTALLKFCKFHSISAIVAMALEEYWRASPAAPEVMKPWKQAKDMAIRKNILLNAERERILQHLESIGCWYMPLKGSLLQHDYPRFGMRQMGDNDILIDPAMQAQVHEFMCSEGYEAALYQLGNHDEYVKQPLYNFEMHMCLFERIMDPVLADYYTDRTELLQKDEGNGFGYHMSCEDFYIYLTAHAYKHFVLSGIGIRHLLDVYVYLGKYEQTMDWAYVERDLRKMDAWEFHCQCRALSQALFASPRREHARSEEEIQLLGAFFSAGAYGTPEQRVQKSLQTLQRGSETAGLLTKIRYVFMRIFPSVERLSMMHPEVKESKWKVFVVWAKRLLSAVFLHPLKTLREIGNLWRAKSKE